MEKSNIYRLYVLIAVSIMFIGCGSPQRHTLQSPYSDFYDNNFVGIEVPEATVIRSLGDTWTFSKPVDEVWDVILQVIKQYEGVIDMATEDETDRRVLFVHGHEMLIDFYAANMVYSKFLDTWIAVAVSPTKDNRATEISATWVSPNTAWVSPNTGRIAPVELSKNDYISEDMVLPDMSTTQILTSAKVVHGFDDIAIALSEERMKIAIGLSQAKTPEQRWKLVPQATINEFFYHITTQLYGPERWKEKYLDTYASPQESLKKIENIEVSDDSKYDKHKSLVQNSGNWMSIRLRDSYLVVNSPNMENLLTEILDRLKQTSGEKNRKTEIYIIASPDINAFSLPNGDIFVCSGLLEALHSVDEVAAVLAHELDHYLQNDTAHRLFSMENARKTQKALQTAGSILGQVGGIVVGIVMTPVSQMATSGMSMSGQMASSVLSSTVSTMSGIVGESMASSIVTGYSFESELRADSNGARYLWAAGYNVDAELELLQKLKDARVEATKRSEPITSGFINAQPGLEERTKRMIAVIEELKR